MDTATKIGMDAPKTVPKWVVQKTADAISDLIGNKIADKITSVGKSKKDTIEPQQNNAAYETNMLTRIYIPPQRRQQIIDDLRLIWARIKMEYQTIINLLDITPDTMPRFNTKKWIKVHDHSGGTYNTSKKTRFVHVTIRFV